MHVDMRPLCAAVGLGISLILNGLLLAKHINKAELLTLPDFYA